MKNSSYWQQSKKIILFQQYTVIWICGKRCIVLTMRIPGGGKQLPGASRGLRKGEGGRSLLPRMLIIILNTWPTLILVHLRKTTPECRGRKLSAPGCDSDLSGILRIKVFFLVKEPACLFCLIFAVVQNNFPAALDLCNYPSAALIRFYFVSHA